MSDLPEIDYQKVAIRVTEELGNEVTNLKFEKKSLEVLAEQLRDQRDEALRNLADLQQVLTEMQPQSEQPEEEVVEGQIVEEPQAD